jgi:hypothetical protein
LGAQIHREDALHYSRVGSCNECEYRGREVFFKMLIMAAAKKGFLSRNGIFPARQQI